MRGDDALPWILPQAHPFPQRIGDAAAAGAHAIMTKFFPRARGCCRRLGAVVHH